VGKKVKVRVERIQPGALYATLVGGAKPATGAITAEGEAEKPTRQPAAKKATAAPKAKAAPKPEAEETVETTADADEPKPKKKTRRGSRGGRRRKKPAAATTTTAAGANGADPAEGRGPTIHVPSADLGQAGDETVAEDADVAEAAAGDNGAEPAKPRKKTRRGSRGGRNRRKKPTAAPAESAPKDGESG
jgi:hypothetical protein